MLLIEHNHWQYFEILYEKRLLPIKHNLSTLNSKLILLLLSQ